MTNEKFGDGCSETNIWPWSTPLKAVVAIIVFFGVPAMLHLSTSGVEWGENFYEYYKYIVFGPLSVTMAVIVVIFLSGMGSKKKAVAVLAVFFADAVFWHALWSTNFEGSFFQTLTSHWSLVFAGLLLVIFARNFWDLVVGTLTFLLQEFGFVGNLELDKLPADKRKSRKSVRNVMIAVGLFFALVGALYSYQLSTGSYDFGFTAVLMSPASVVIALIVMTLFARSFWDVLVKQGVGNIILFEASTQKKSLTAESGKVVWSSNSVVTITSGSSYSAPVTGSGGYVTGGSGGGSVSTSVKNVEKARIALFNGGERNIELDCDPLFSPGNIVTIVYRGKRPLGYYNQTTDRWYDMVSLPFELRIVGFATWLASAFLGVQAIGAAFYMNKYANVGLGSTVFWSLLMIFVAFMAIKFRQNNLNAARDAVISIVRDHDKLNAKQVAQSQDSWRKMVEDL